MPAPQEILGYFFNWRTLTDQIRRSSRSVCANLAEAW
ncbi:four helix bundle protein, partial [Anabaena sp. PCC 7938]